MKHLSSKFFCVTVVIAMGSSYAIEYVEGYLGIPLPLGFFPAILISFPCLVLLVGLLVNALIKRRSAGKALLFLGIALLSIVPIFSLNPTMTFQAGFRQKIKSTLSPDEIRTIAWLCHKTLPPDGRLPGPGKRSLWNEPEHRPQWNVLIGASSLGKLDPSLTIFNHTDSVEIAWGGALVGHWGLDIQTDGKTESGDISEGIQTFISSD